ELIDRIQLACIKYGETDSFSSDWLPKHDETKQLIDELLALERREKLRKWFLCQINLPINQTAEQFRN
ncbi:MAG: hypothetical protein LBB88_09730, partial [Planctomycetaceae bacterium]|nr:hypothetical protein [Planctomycetaceae bacterium]